LMATSSSFIKRAIIPDIELAMLRWVSLSSCYHINAR
jgi:hypothetical protein